MNSSKQKLPAGWVNTILNSIGSWSTGGTPSRKVSSYFNGDIPWIKSGDLNDGLILQTEETITIDGLENSSAKLLPKQTISMALYGATIGKLGILGIEAATNQACANCEANASFADHVFVFYYLWSQRQLLIEQGQGGAQPNLTNAIVRNWPISLPPLAEQKRIVDVVEKLFVRVNNAKQRLGNAAKTMKRFRRSVLNASCTGKLTEDWRNKYFSTEERQSQELLRIDLPKSWIVAKIHEFASKVGSGATPRGGKKSYKSTGIPLIRSQNIHFEGFNKKGLAFIDKTQAEALKSVEVRTNDVLLNITGASIGRVTLAPEEMDGGRVNQHVCIIRPEKIVLPAFLSYFLTSPVMQNFIMKKQYGVTRQALTKGMILDFDIPIPPPDEQKEIIQRVEKLFTLTNKIKEHVKTATEKAEKLTQSILAKAFRGELVPTEAELAKIQGRTYETAEQLLERIQEERKRLKVKKPKRKQKLVTAFVLNTAHIASEEVTVTTLGSLFEIISESKDGVKPEALLEASKYSIDTIENFYEELAKLEKDGKIEDYRPNNRLSLLRIKK